MTAFGNSGMIPLTWQGFEWIRLTLGRIHQRLSLQNDLRKFNWENAAPLITRLTRRYSGRRRRAIRDFGCEVKKFSNRLSNRLWKGHMHTFKNLQLKLYEMDLQRHFRHDTWCSVLKWAKADGRGLMYSSYFWHTIVQVGCSDLGSGWASCFPRKLLLTSLSLVLITSCPRILERNTVFATLSKTIQFSMKSSVEWYQSWPNSIISIFDDVIVSAVSA